MLQKSNIQVSYDLQKITNQNNSFGENMGP